MGKERVSPLVYARVVRALGLVGPTESAFDDRSEGALTQLAQRLEYEFELFSISVHIDELRKVDSILSLAQMISDKIGD